MDTISLATKYAQDPITLVAVTILLHTVTQFIQAVKLKPTTKGIHDAHFTTHTEQLNSLNQTVGEVCKVVAEIANALGTITASQNDIDETEDRVAKELERLIVLVHDLLAIHKDPYSKFSTVTVLKKEDEIIQLLNDIKVVLARLR